MSHRQTISPKRLFGVLEQLATDPNVSPEFAAVLGADAEPDEYECPACAGTGEGPADGYACSYCRGRGF